jgi:glycogen debranching enzyme
MYYVHKDECSDEVMKIVNGFFDHLDEAGLGNISEIFDGDAPYTPRGCFGQAWSVAELLRVSVEHELWKPKKKQSQSVSNFEPVK